MFFWSSCGKFFFYTSTASGCVEGNMCLPPVLTSCSPLWLRCHKSLLVMRGSRSNSHKLPCSHGSNFPMAEADQPYIQNMQGNAASADLTLLNKSFSRSLLRTRHPQDKRNCKSEKTYLMLKHIKSATWTSYLHIGAAFRHTSSAFPFCLCILPAFTRLLTKASEGMQTLSSSSSSSTFFLLNNSSNPKRVPEGATVYVCACLHNFWTGPGCTLFILLALFPPTHQSTAKKILKTRYIRPRKWRGAP